MTIEIKLYEKRFYIRGTLRSIRSSPLSKIPTLYRDWLRSLNKKRVDYLSCIEGEGGLKDIHYSAQNAALFVNLL